MELAAYILANVYFAMNKWLQNFTYRTDIGIWTFVVSAVMALAIALTTVSYQANGKSSGGVEI